MIQSIPPGTPETACLHLALQCDPFQSLMKEVSELFPPRVEWYLVGGSVRDVLLRHLAGMSVVIHDLDIIVDVGDELETLLEKLPGSLDRTPLGGYRWLPSPDSLYVDVWSVRNSFAVTTFKLPATIDNFLLGVPFNMERICLNLNTGILLDGGCIEGIRTHTIKYDPAWPYLLPVQAARAMALYRKTRFELDLSVHNLLLRSKWWDHRDEISEFLGANRYSAFDSEEIWELLEQNTRRG